MRLLHILSVSVLFLLPKAASANPISDYEQQLFINTWAKLAVEQMGQYGVPASITLAQAIVESGWGRGTVATKGNNYFCIKSNNGWTGPIVKAKDDEVDSSSFRQYLSIEESFDDHSRFLRENIRYRPLFLLQPTDYRGWAKGLKDCGYATATDYAKQLISTIEKYGLYNYDAAVPVEQIQALGLPFGELEEAGELLVPMANMPTAAPQVADAPKLPANGSEHLLQVPGYHLNNKAQAYSLPTAPSVEMPGTKASMKISLILPKAAPKFARR